VVLKEKVFQGSRQTFVFYDYIPLWRGPCPLFEEFRIPFTQGWFVLSLIDIGVLVLEKIFSPISGYFLLLFPLERGIALHMNNSESPSPKDYLCQPWSQSAQRFWWRSQKFKILTDRRDKRRSEKLTWAFSSGELKKKARDATTQLQDTYHSISFTIWYESRYTVLIHQSN
jgi:hypothetical protein